MKVRKNKQTFSEPVPAHWAGEDALQSHILNVLSLMFPGGEGFFIRSVKQFKDQINDPQLQEQIKGFIGQEMQHTMAHEHFNESVQKNIADMAWFNWLFTVPTFKWLEPFARETIGSTFLHKIMLAMTAAAENMTGGFAQSLFAPGQAERILREDVRELYLWHAAEEMEHRDLAYDVFEKVSGDYPTRVLAMVLTYGIISGYVAVGTAYLMFTDREFPWAKLPKQAWDLFTQENAIGRVFLEGMIDYLRPDFHPSQHPMHQGALEYLAKFEKAAS